MGKRTPRTFLVVIDDSKEMDVALRFAALRARLSQGRVAMLYAIEKDEIIQPWAGVEATMEKDALVRAREELAVHKKLVEELSGSKPELFIRKGSRRDVLLQLLKEQPEISVLVLAARTGDEGPGPLIAYLTSAKGMSALKIPLVIVPDTCDVDSNLLPVE